MYDQILVPMALDHGFSQTAFAVARKLLNPGGRITALHVYEAASGTVSAYLDEEVVRAAYAAAEARLAERLKDHPDVTSKMVKGHSGRSIIDVANQIDAGLIVIGSHRPGLIDYLLGSTAARVVRHSQCAVHVLRTPA